MLLCLVVDMLNLKQYIDPAPPIEEIQDEKVVKTKYNYWRFRILYATFIGYAFYYFTRKSFTFAMPGMIEELGFDKGQLGLLSTIFSLTYGMSKFAAGIMSDRSSPRYFMGFGLIMTGIINIFFGMSSSLFMFAMLWGFNGLFQAFGWPPCARFLTHWYSHSERGSWWSTWNVSHNVGAFLIPWVAGFALQYWGWRYAMYIPGIICIFGGFYLFNRLRDTPESLGLPPIEKYRGDYVCAPEDKHMPSTKEILLEYVLKNKFIWVLSIAYLFVYIVRTGVNDWTALFLIESKGYSQITANGCVSLFEVGGAFGSLSAGWISDKVFQARRGPVNALFAGGVLITLLLFWMVPPGNQFLDSFLVFWIGFMIFGPQMLIGVAAAELSHKEAAATATGFAGWFAYTGAAMAGYPLGKIAQSQGWDGFFITMILCAVLSILLLVPLWNVTENRRKK